MTYALYILGVPLMLILICPMLVWRGLFRVYAVSTSLLLLLSWLELALRHSITLFSVSPLLSQLGREVLIIYSIAHLVGLAVRWVLRSDVPVEPPHTLNQP